MKNKPYVSAGCDTVVECKKCGRRQHLNFVNGLKNGWSKCCGYTMPIIYIKNNDVAKVVENSVKALFAPMSDALKRTANAEFVKILNKKKAWSVS